MNVLSHSPPPYLNFLALITLHIRPGGRVAHNPAQPGEG